MSGLSGQVAVITGASRGIGAAAARALSEAGASVALLARGASEISALEREIASAGGRALAVECDVADFGAVEQAMARVRETLGPVSILVNNAGTVEPIGALAELDPEAVTQALRVNLGGAFACIRAVLPGMLEAGGGTVINISSGAANQALEGWSAYCASKAGLAMLTQSLAHECAGHGIRAFGFKPGVVDTEMQSVIRASGINPVSQLPRGSLAPPERPAKVIVWLCGDEADDLAGQEISIRDPELQRRAGLEPVS